MIISILFESSLLHGFLLSELARQDIVLSTLLAGLILASLLLLHRLQAHPLFVAICLFLIAHLLFHFFASIHLSQVSNLLSLINLLLHKPIIHSLASRLVFLALILGY